MEVKRWRGLAAARVASPRHLGPRAHLQLRRNDVGVALLRLSVVGAVVVGLCPHGPVLQQRQPLLLHRHVAARLLRRRRRLALLAAQGVVDDGRSKAAGARHGRGRVFVHLRVAQPGRQRLGRALAVRRLLNQARQAQAHERRARQRYRNGEPAARRQGEHGRVRGGGSHKEIGAERAIARARARTRLNAALDAPIVDDAV